MCSISELEVAIQANCWLARVASFSNVADKALRGDIKNLVDSGFLNDSTEALQKVTQLLAFTKEKLGRRAECIVASPT